MNFFPSFAIHKKKVYDRLGKYYLIFILCEKGKNVVNKKEGYSLSSLLSFF